MAEKKNRGPHQAKNKPVFANEFSAVTGGSVLKVSDPNAPSADERKTVILDEDFEGLEFEDKAWLYWRRNKNFILSLIVLAFAFVLGSNAWKFYVSSQREAVASEFAAADSFDAKNQFAAANVNTPAAGIALVQNADVLYKEGKFSDAAKLYETAAEYLKGGSLYGRAALGNAMSLLKAGGLEAGKAALESLAANQSAGVYSAEAAYHLGVLAFASGDSAEARRQFALAESNPRAGAWAELARRYQSRM